MNLLEDVKKYFGIQTFRDSQEQIIRVILAGRDVMAVLPTGAGKSLCYQYPAVKFRGLTIVVSPLVALMEDQVRNLQKRGIAAAALNRMTEESEYANILSSVAKGTCKLLYVSPERLKFARFVSFIRQFPIDMLVVDEAHCISVWGYDFRPDYLYIRQFVRKLHRRPVIAAFSATATPYIRQDVTGILGMKRPAVFEARYVRENLKLSVMPFRSDAGKYASLYAFLRSHAGESGIIYCATVAYVQKVYQKLCDAGYADQTACYYADLDASRKDKDYQDFMNRDKTIMVATNAFGMGIDKADIRFVIHFNLPQSLENYDQEIGRAGRDGQSSECVLYYLPKDGNIIRKLQKKQEKQTFPDPRINEAMEALSTQRINELESFAQSGVDADSADIHARLDAYFANWMPLEYEQIQWKEIQAQIEKQISTIPILYTNVTMIASGLRNGNFPCGEELRVSIGDTETAFRIDTVLDYFDMMVADAVYTLWFHNEDIINSVKILRVLSGNPDATLNRHKNKKGQLLDERAEQISDSLDKLAQTTICINGTEEHFLCAEKSAKKQGEYTLTKPMLLYRYAEDLKQIRTVRREFLCILRENNSPWDNSLENLKLRHYLSRRIVLAGTGTYRRGAGYRPVSRRIRFEQGRSDRKGMWEILGIDFGYSGQPHLRRRRWETLCAKVEQVLTYYKRQGLISGYQWILGESEFGAKERIGIEFH